MTSSLKFEKFNKIELEKQRLLFSECFPETLNTSVNSNEHYDWKFHKFPNSPTSYEYISSEGTNLIGYYAALPYSYRVFNENKLVGMVCDVMTGVAARGKGIFTKIGKFATDDLKEQGIDFTIGYPIRKEVIPGHLKVGWDVVFELPMYISFLKFSSFFKSKSIGWISIPFDIACLILFKIEKLFSKNENIRFEILNKNEFIKWKDLDQFISKWQDQQKISLNKSKEFYNWRLFAPCTEYNIIIMYINEIPAGVSIVREVVQNKIPTLAILDFMILKENLSYSSNLIFQIKNFAYERKREFIICMMNKSIYGRYAFLKSLFIRSPFIFKLIIKK
ncbi:MAG: GNAT family N-acetyltransferase [Leptospira sp.]|nr:GNAT family N-acetyltransferase [Leptospira sp.]